MLEGILILGSLTAAIYFYSEMRETKASNEQLERRTKSIYKEVRYHQSHQNVNPGILHTIYSRFTKVGTKTIKTDLDDDSSKADEQLTSDSKTNHLKSEPFASEKESLKGQNYSLSDTAEHNKTASRETLGPSEGSEMVNNDPAKDILVNEDGEIKQATDLSRPSYADAMQQKDIHDDDEILQSSTTYMQQMMTPDESGPESHYKPQSKDDVASDSELSKDKQPDSQWSNLINASNKLLK